MKDLQQIPEINEATTKLIETYFKNQCDLTDILSHLTTITSCIIVGAIADARTSGQDIDDKGAEDIVCAYNEAFNKTLSAQLEERTKQLNMTIEV